MMSSLDVEIPDKLRFLFEPKRYKVVHSGRGASKSWTFAIVLLIMAIKRPLRVLCTRELQMSIQESVHEVLSQQISRLGLDKYYEIQKTTIKGINGSEFIFSGLKGNITKIKSMEGIDICWVEEAEAISEESWKVLIPTIRKDGSEIWVSFNPDQKTDPTYKRFVLHPPDDAIVVEISWRDNPWFPESLRKHRDHLLSVDPDAEAHVYGGQTRQRSEAQIFRGKWVVGPFESKEGWFGPYQGADWGMTNPTAMIRCWVTDSEIDEVSDDDAIIPRELWIEHEAYDIGVDLDELPAMFDQIPDARKYTTRADNSRPETIRHMQNHGYPLMIAAKKWDGSVEDGIAHIRSYKRIVVHPRCKHTIEELRLYSHKVDPKSGDVLPEIVKKHDHIPDAIRYSLDPLIKHQEFAFDPDLMQPEQENPWEFNY